MSDFMSQFQDIPTEVIKSHEEISSAVSSEKSYQTTKSASRQATPISAGEAEEVNADEKGSETPDLYDLRSAYQDLIIAPQVTHEDIISVHGKVKHLTCSFYCNNVPKSILILALYTTQQNI